MTSSLESLRTLIAQHYGLAPERLQPDTRLDALGFDSLGTAELLWLVEEAFDLELTRDPVGLRTLGDVVRTIDLHTAPRRPGNTPGRPLPAR